MKPLDNGLYSYTEKEVKNEKGEVVKPSRLRMWHDCLKYKSEPTARVELVAVKNGFRCPHCGFTKDYKRG